MILSREWNVPCPVRTALHALAARRSSEEKTASVFTERHPRVYFFTLIYKPHFAHAPPLNSPLGFQVSRFSRSVTSLLSCGSRVTREVRFEARPILSSFSTPTNSIFQNHKKLHE